MKILIWFVCILAASFIQETLKDAGIGGVIPAILVCGGMIYSAKFLCGKYESKRAKKTFAKDSRIEPIVERDHAEKATDSPDSYEGKMITPSDVINGSPIEVEEGEPNSYQRNRLYYGNRIDVVSMGRRKQEESKKRKQRYCKLCGQAIDGSSKKCMGCGKQYFKMGAKSFGTVCVLALTVLISGYIGINYFCAVSAMNNQEFIKSKQFFDNLLVSDVIFPGKYEYVQAGVLMEEGKYIESLNAFKEVKAISVPAATTDFLKATIYSAGKAAYNNGDLEEAKRNFKAINGYKRSSDYMLLVICSDGGGSAESLAKNNYSSLVKLLGFENADEILMKYQSTALEFLIGRWENGSKFFEIKDNYNSSNNLPHKNGDGYYSISEGVYFVGSAKCFEFSIIDEDTIAVYCYKDGSTYKLYRQ